MSKDILTLRVEGEVIAELDAIAQEISLTRSEFAEHLLCLGLDEYKKTVKLLGGGVFGRVIAGALSRPAVWQALGALAGESVSGHEAKKFSEAIQEGARVGKKIRPKRKGIHKA